MKRFDQAVFDYVKERVRRLDARFMMAVEEDFPTALYLESAGKPLASIDISLDDDPNPTRLNCSMWLRGAGKDGVSAEDNSWDISDAESLDRISSQVADWVLGQLQLVMRKP